jgi:hypothetical protein
VSSSSRSSGRAASPRRPRFSRCFAASAPALAALLLAAGCGGGDEKHDTFVAGVNAACKRHLDSVDALASPQSSQQLVTYVDELTRLARRQLRELRALEPTGDDRDEYGRMLGRLETTLALYPDLRDAVVTGRASAIDSIVRRANSSSQEAAEAAIALGADECARADEG